MIYAYDESYIDMAMKNLGEAFDYAINLCNLDADEFLHLFISSGLANGFENGEPKLIVGLSGTELVMEILTKVGLKISFPKPQIEYEYSREYWCGWILAYYQWKNNKTFKSIYEDISMKEILKLYPILHETSEDKSVDTINSIISHKENISKLQKQRKKCGYSQSELAKKSGVNLRTLQQYELKTKDINKASVQTVIALSKTLGCSIDEILEYTEN